MRVRPTGEWRNRSLGGLALTAALLLPDTAAAQVQSQVQGQFPGQGLGPSQTQRSQAPSFGTTTQADPLADATSGDTPPLRPTRDGAVDTGAGLPASGDTPSGESGAGLPSPTRASTAFRASSGPNNRALGPILRRRAAPARRFGTATTRVTRQITQSSPTDLRLTPVVRTAVVGVPLPTLLPLAGIQTPGFLFGGSLRQPLAVDQAYAPLGIKLGTFTFLPSFQQSIGYDTNPEQITRLAAKPSVALRTEADLTFRSDWSASELSGELRGAYLDYPDNQAASRPNGLGATRLRIDANRDTRIDVEGRFLIDTQRTGTPDLNVGSATRPLVMSYGTTVGVTEVFNRLQLSLRGLLDRSQFEDARLGDGTVITQSDRNLNQYGLQLRAGYEVSPSLTPFVDVLADTRVYDRRVDTSGTRRDSDGLTLSAGATIALTRFVSGEVSAGLQHRTYNDPTLRDLTAPVMNASLIWTASPLTTVRLNATAGVVETAVTGSGGVRTQAVTLEVQHDLLRNLSLIGGITYVASDYDRVNISERGFSATARLDYRFNRWLSLRGSYIYQQVESSIATASFTSNTWLLGLRVNP
ncbi:outer membrane beta-barrel protein [Methylobacterium sp. J-090]|uniref:outer membrane beta-barrel protein n=1 Tax=Methylobacterium sp. J-090 TaxID=2836666 RepID=UPI001FB9C893|nr:outer membrane beta-barrel protein [Methylobacterium sp. J-090]MCJ2083685.1 outer membrane beta-barrel protein [Methylobacterium sp. J-090]